ncbi:2-hydroxyacylsphingosine 1-beta-galactosyltransferase-like [Bolinopsis microptera]|uniref:2-hydroxyacylsphingosine 1-beta-galactosyltransferase-like n=1 Tax=Bolinopsis microptera TaxID=2820187 RepID=UPI0030798DD4
MMNSRDFHRSPSFTERLSGLSTAFKMFPFIQTGQRILQPFLEKFGFSVQEVTDSVKLFLTNGHPALTFPFLRPPNNILIGCANLLGSKSAPLQFSPQISQFLNESVGKDVVYVSFGPYVKMSGVSWYSQLVEILTELDLRVIVKVDKEFEKEFPKSVLPLNWAPQKDLLRSGKIKLFISHCGNNGKMETIYYNVPVLCIPQFADQPVNAELVKVKGFGESLMKEDISVRAKEVIAAMIANHGTYHRNMKRASDIVENEPGNARENLLYYVEQVAEMGNVDYLVNKVARQQSTVEMYNLDIVVPVVVIVIVVVGFILYVLLKFCVYFSRKVGMAGFRKLKNE